MTQYEFILAAGTWNDVDVEREHLEGQPVRMRLASLQTADDIARESDGVDGIIVTWNPMPREHINALGRSVRIIARAGIGLDAIDLNAAKERGIAVFHVPDYCTDEVATHAVGMIVALNRRLVQANRVAREDWLGWKVLGEVVPLSSLTVGVLGAGRIGQAVVTKLLSLCGRVLTYDPYVAEAPAGATAASSLDELLRSSDVITLHMPLVDETRGIIGARELELLKPGAVVVNVSRGGLLDGRALAAALESGHLSGAGLDVLEHEPPAPDDPILQAPNVILTPHFAWYSVASERRARTISVDGMLDYLEGRKPRAGRLAVVPEM
jgi:D-3-phosphoglycerate dehydrogenase / 2-oxoglutarate reductase